MITAFRKSRAATAKDQNARFEDDQVVLVLNAGGVIMECSNAGKLLGYSPHQLIWKHVSTVLPQLKDMGPEHPLLSSRIRYLSHMGHCFEVRAQDGSNQLSKVFFTDLDDGPQHQLRVLICPVEDGHPNAEIYF